jgi:hypothetical protein
MVQRRVAGCQIQTGQDRVFAAQALQCCYGPLIQARVEIDLADLYR